MGGLEDDPFLFARAYFQGARSVSFKEGNISRTFLLPSSESSTVAISWNKPAAVRPWKSVDCPNMKGSSWNHPFSEADLVSFRECTQVGRFSRDKAHEHLSRLMTVSKCIKMTGAVHMSLCNVVYDTLLEAFLYTRQTLLFWSQHQPPKATGVNTITPPPAINGHTVKQQKVYKQTFKQKNKTLKTNHLNRNDANRSNRDPPSDTFSNPHLDDPSFFQVSCWPPRYP